MPTLLPRESMVATSVIPASIQRPSPSDHRVGFSDSFTRLRLGSLALRPASLSLRNSRPSITRTPLLRATKANGQFLGRDFNPLAKLLLLRTSVPFLFLLINHRSGFTFLCFLSAADRRSGMRPDLRTFEYCSLTQIISSRSESLPL